MNCCCRERSPVRSVRKQSPSPPARRNRDVRASSPPRRERPTEKAAEGKGSQKSSSSRTKVKSVSRSSSGSSRSKSRTPIKKSSRNIPEDSGSEKQRTKESLDVGKKGRAVYEEKQLKEIVARKKELSEHRSVQGSDQEDDGSPPPKRMKEQIEVTFIYYFYTHIFLLTDCCLPSN